MRKGEMGAVREETEVRLVSEGKFAGGGGVGLAM